jgi:hypothetical protein
LQEEHVPRAQHVLGLYLEVPLVVATDGYGAHTGLNGKVHVAQGPAVQGALRVDADAGGYLLGLGDVVQELWRDA